mgnify:CR=1 FL=1
MNAVESNDATRAWERLGGRLPRPEAILCVSAHWMTDGFQVTEARAPRILHDFYGFPKKLFEIQYPAPGSPDLARQVVDTVAPQWVGTDTDSWGLDHGTWSVLVHMFPDADVPVVQLSLDATKSFADHLSLGAALAPLRDDGVLIVCSGNVVHNLRAIAWGAEDRGFDWADRFDLDARGLMLDRPDDLGDLTGSADFALSVPTPDHFLPLAYVAGAASATDAKVSTITEGRTLGSLSMTSYQALVA